MAGILDSVDQRTQLVGENRLEILMFRLAGRQLFAINVFKVQEVLQLPKLTLMPQRHAYVCGVVNLRGQTLPVIDLSQAIGMRPLQPGPDSTIIVTEYNRSVQAFLVGGVDRIVNMTWESILPPPTSAGRQHYLTATWKRSWPKSSPTTPRCPATSSKTHCSHRPAAAKCCWWTTPPWPWRSCAKP
jgi:two-component system chemotaxis response regulator CheV